MPLANPTLLYTADAVLEEGLRQRLEAEPSFLVHAPHWEAFTRLVAQLVFGVVVVDFACLLDEDGSASGDLMKRMIEETTESNSHARILVYNVPDEEMIGVLLAAGVHNVVRAPLSLEELELRIRRSAEEYAWTAQRNYYVGRSGHIFQVDDIVGDSPQLKNVLEQVRKIAPSRSPVLITGETGVGKELIAAAIHYNSPRSDGPFVKVNCAALQETLLESDLFGHEKGSFTGAVKQRIGRFEQAHGGTLFMDEIGEMSPAVQAKVLRVLQTQEFERVGGTRTIRVDVRVIAATNRVLEEAIRTGAFREDLFYRLNVVSIHIPPLRERTADIPMLARFFLKKARIEERKQVLDFTRDAMAFMQSYPWPGNVREMENTVYQAVLLAETDHVRTQDLAIVQRPRPTEAHPSLSDAAQPPGAAVGYPPGGIPNDVSAVGPAGSPSVGSPNEVRGDGEAETGGEEPGATLNLEEVEKRAILEALTTAAWVQSRAAKLLGVSRRALNYKIAKYGITHPSWRVHT